MPCPPLALPLAALLALSAALRAQDADKLMLALDVGGHTGRVWRVLFTPDDKELVTVSADKTVRTWDVATGEPLRVLRPPASLTEGQLYAAALSPDGKTLAVGGGRRYINLINMASGQIERSLEGSLNGSEDLVFSRDGSRLAGGGGSLAFVWDTASGKELLMLQGHERQVSGVAFSPDGGRLVTASLDRTARVWSVTTGKCLATLEGHEQGVYCVAWSPGGETIATGSDDHSVRLWDADGKPGRVFGGLGSEITSVRFAPDGRKLLFTRGAGETKVCSILDPTSGKEVTRFGEHTNTVIHGNLSHDGRLAATTGGDDQETFIWRTASGEVVHRLKGKGRVAWAAGWGGGGLIAWGNTNKAVGANADDPLERTFDLAGLKFGPPPDATFRRARAARGSVSLEATGRSTVTVKRPGQPDLELKLPDALDRVRGFTLLPDDLAAVCSSTGLRLFDARTGKRLCVYQGHTGVVWAVAPSPDGRFLLTASGDQTVRVWPAGRDHQMHAAGDDTDDPLVSLFVAGDEWVAWTPEGYYGCSPGGEKLMGWHVNNGMTVTDWSGTKGTDKMANFYPAEKFRKNFYRPDIIQRLLDAGSVKRAVTLADEARGKRTERTKVAEVLPPKVAITSPTSGSKLDQSEVVVRATANSVGDHPVTALRLLIDGRPQGQPKRVDQPRVGEVSESWTVQLSPGKHRLQALADSAVSNGMSSEVEVIYSSPAAPEIVLPKLYVLAIGVSAYNEETLKLNYAAKDAEAVADAFRTHSKQLFRSIEVKLVTDAKATRSGVFAGVKWLRTQITQNDVGVVFFSGHGDKDGGSLYFLPADADPSDLAGTCVSATEMTNVIAALPGKILLILDACHSGGADAPKKKNAGSLTDDLVRDLVTDEKGLIVMASSAGREASLENNKLRLGNFTAALTEGLSGKAHKVDGAIYLTHLDAYVTDRVKELTNGRQHPVTAKPTSVRSFPLSKP